VRGTAERIGDRGAAVDGKCRPQAPLDLRDQHPPGRDCGAVELGQRVEAIRVGGGGEPEHDIR